MAVTAVTGDPSRLSLDPSRPVPDRHGVTGTPSRRHPTRSDAGGMCAEGGGGSRGTSARGMQVPRTRVVIGPFHGLMLSLFECCVFRCEMSVIYLLHTAYTSVLLCRSTRVPDVIYDTILYKSQN